MKKINKIKQLGLFVLLLGFLEMPDSVWGASIDDYNYLPPFLGVDITPNILILLDNSGSMNSCVYPNSNKGGGDCQNFTNSSDYDATSFYGGYFERDKCYAYSRIDKKFTNSIAKTGSCSDPKPWDGNFLNWVTMKRIDIAKWALTGGQCNEVRSDENKCATLRLPSNDKSVLHKKASLSGVGPSMFGNSYRCIKVIFGDFFIGSNASCSEATKECIGSQKTPISKCTNPGGTSLFEIRVDTGANQTGVIQNIGNRARFGLEVFNKTDAGRILVDVGRDLLTLVREIEKQIPNTNTPLAEALYEGCLLYTSPSPRD